VAHGAELRGELSVHCNCLGEPSHLLRFAEHATPRLIWWNFAHLFFVSLVPFSTAWIALTRFAAVPVAVYAAIFVMVNSAYLAFVWEVLAQAEVQEKVSARMRQMTRVRSFVTLIFFVIAMVLFQRIRGGSFDRKSFFVTFHEGRKAMNIPLIGSYRRAIVPCKDFVGEIGF
jgi:hypothetical protein